MRSNRRKALGLVLALLITMSYFSPVQVALRSWPETIILAEGQTEALSLPQPLRLTRHTEERPVHASEDELLDTKGQQARLTLSLLGIPLRQTRVELTPEKRLIPGGMAIGVAMRTSGVLVVGMGEIGGESSPAARCGIRPGDVLCRVDGVEIRSAEQLTELIAELGAKPVQVEYLHDGSRRTATLTPMLDKTSGAVRLGAWVRDSTAGIGTMTFYDPADGSFAALGHPITDGDTGRVLAVSQGQVLAADVIAVQRGQRGAPGELKGSFLRDPTVIGSIADNGEMGVYGRLNSAPNQPLFPDGLPVGLRSGVHTGAASIISTVNGDGPQLFEVEITRVNPQSAPAPKSMVVHVTDERLLAMTGGIVQGMSGSPIVQDGRLIGAVTHVFVSDPTQGYGLYIDWMLNAAGESAEADDGQDKAACVPTEAQWI